ncbi:MAG: hypothetical protein Kow00127_20080 [Bacteroidales bacterium]
MKRSSAIFIIGLLILWIAGLAIAQESYQQLPEKSKLEFLSQDQELEQAVQWAINRSYLLASCDDPVGCWYEAALPRRNAFCMRDVAHQAVAAAILGLNPHNKNMISRFAGNVSPSRDFCSFWEIDSTGGPAPADYISDDDFWYNLPAGYDLVHSCFELFRWTGDRDYINSTPFPEFYRLTLTEFTRHWQLTPADWFTRNRYLHQPLPGKGEPLRFFGRRGIPSYHEAGNSATLLGIDLSAAMYAGFMAGAQMMQLTGNNKQALEYNLTAKTIASAIDSLFYFPERQEFATIFYENGDTSWFLAAPGNAYSFYLLHFGVPLDEERKQNLLKPYLRLGESLTVELASHLPLIFYRNGYPDRARDMILNLASPNRNRRDYPEVAFSVVDAVVRGMLGLEADAVSNRIVLSPVRGVPPVRVNNIHLLGGTIDVAVDGNEIRIVSRLEVPVIIAVMPDRESGNQSDSSRRHDTAQPGIKVRVFPGDTCTLQLL